MSIFILERKTFSEKKKGLSKNKKAALAGIGTLTTAAGGFYGARKGMLGKGLAMSSNKAWGKIGSKLGNEGMMKSGAHGYGKARAKRDVENFVKSVKDLEKLSNGSKKISNMSKKSLKDIKNNVINKLSNEYEEKELSNLIKSYKNSGKTIKSSKNGTVINKIKSIFSKKK